MTLLSSKIVGGQPSEDKIKNCVVRIRHTDYYIVSNGALISPYHVITSGGHFGVQESVDFLGKYFIQIGLISLDNPGQINMIKKLIRHRNYNYARDTACEFAIILVSDFT